MAGALNQSFAGIISLARTRLSRISIEEEFDKDRAILVIEGYFQEYRVIIKETINQNRRRYAYYILHDDSVLAGLDNHPDRQALRAKYGTAYSDHIHELIPHLHSPRKQNVTMTGEWTAPQFINGLEGLIATVRDESAPRR